MEVLDRLAVVNKRFCLQIVEVLDQLAVVNKPVLFTDCGGTRSVLGQMQPGCEVSFIVYF